MPDYHEHFVATSISTASRNYYGINAIKNTCNLFSNESGIDYDDFKNIHFLYEHKKSIKNKLNYIKKQGYLNDDSNNIIGEYGEIVQQYEVPRMLALKTLYLSDIKMKMSNQEKIKEKIQKLIDKEVSCLIKTIKRIKFITSSKSIDLLNFEAVLKEDILGTSEYQYAQKLTFIWKDWKEIKTIIIPKYNLINIFADNVEKYKLFSAYAQPDIDYIYDANFKCKMIELLVYSTVEICRDVLPIFYQNDLTYKKTIRVSSNYNDNFSIDINGYGYWRAAAQLKEYNGSDWLEVDFGEITKINTIIVGELDYSPRLIKYRVLFCDETNHWRELFVHNFKKGQEQLHSFDTISITKLRVEFLNVK